jgi:hypothetical protein
VIAVPVEDEQRRVVREVGPGDLEDVVGQLASRLPWVK